MYKIPPAEYREQQTFYPLQLRFTLHKRAHETELTKSDVHLAEKADIPAWMDLVRLVIDGYPYLEESEYIQKLTDSIQRKNALVLKDENILIGVLAFSLDKGSIEFMGVFPMLFLTGLSGNC